MPPSNPPSPLKKNPNIVQTFAKPAETKTWYRTPLKNLKTFLRIITYARNCVKLVILSNILMVAASLLKVSGPKFSGKVIDSLASANQPEKLLELVFSVIGITVFSKILALLQSAVESRVSREVKRGIKQDFFEKLIYKDQEFYDTKKTGEIINSMESDVNKAQKISTVDLTEIFRRILEVGASLYMVHTMSPTLTFLIILLIPPKAYLISRKAKDIKKFQKTVNQVEADITGMVIEVISNIRVVKAFSSERKESQNYNAKLKKIGDLESELDWRSAVFSFLMNIISTCTHAIILWYGGCLVFEGKITAGDLSSILVYGKNLVGAGKIIRQVFEKFAISIGACERVFALLDHKTKIHNREKEGLKIKKMHGSIKFDFVSFHYPSKPEVKTLKSINCEIKGGESVAFVGSSGSGKSTLAGLVERFYDPTEGQVLIDGQNIKDFDLDWLHKKIGYVAQEPTLFSGNIEHNIAYGVESYTPEEMDEAIKMANASFIYDKDAFPDGLKTYVGERGAKLSGGQKQRIAIARALIKNPRILIFDEATSALDADSEHQVQIAIDTLMQKKDRTVIIIAHRLSTIRACNKVCVFDKGKLVEVGTHVELIAKGGFYKQLIDKQLYDNK